MSPTKHKMTSEMLNSYKYIGRRTKEKQHPLIVVMIDDNNSIRIFLAKR